MAIDPQLDMHTLEEALLGLDPRANLKKGDLFILLTDMNERRPIAFEVIDRAVHPEHGVSYSCWELEGSKGKRYRGKKRFIDTARIGKQIPTEPVKNWGER
jgi:hypothetical protein